jgi:hypothetical protein
MPVLARYNTGNTHTYIRAHCGVGTQDLGMQVLRSASEEEFIRKMVVDGRFTYRQN